MSDTQAVEWIGGPHDGAELVLPPTHTEYNLARPRPITDLMDRHQIDENFEPFVESVRLKVQRRKSDGKLVLYWPKGWG